MVPLGVSAHNREEEMRVHTLAEARAVVDIVERWQARYLAALGRRLVYVSDEYYLLAERPFPALDAYDGCPQHENGIGMARTFESEVRAALAGADVAGTGPRSGFFAWVDGAPADGYRAPRETPTNSWRPLASRRRAAWRATGGIVIVTGELGAAVLEPLLDELPGRVRLAAGEERVLRREHRGHRTADGRRRLGRARRVSPSTTVTCCPTSRCRGAGSSTGPRPRSCRASVEIVPTDGGALVHALRRSAS